VDRWTMRYNSVRSPRPATPLVNITCGSLPSTTDSRTRVDQTRYARQRHRLTTLYAAPAAATRSETLPGTALRTVGSEIWIVMPVRLLHQAEISDNLMLCVP